LAVGVAIGASFGMVVTALVKDLMTPLIAAIIKQPDFSKLTFTINGSQFLYGDFINALVAFLIAAAVIYFFVVLPVNKLLLRFYGPPPAPGKAADIALLEEIRDLLKKDDAGEKVL